MISGFRSDFVLVDKPLLGTVLGSDTYCDVDSVVDHIQQWFYSLVEEYITLSDLYKEVPIEMFVI